MERAFAFLILTGLIKGMVYAHFGKNVPVTIKMLWSEARNYCREHHTDLSSVHSAKDNGELYKIRHAQGSPNAWIGLYKDANGTWKWSGGETASFFNWSTEQIQNGEAGSCVAYNTKGWETKDCKKAELYFYCFQSSLVLVQENKTWEEAMEHCHRQNSNLISLTSEATLTEMLQMSRKAQTDHLWTGLRYLAGSWLWLNGNNTEYQGRSPGEMLQCPKMNHHCGALSLKAQQRVDWDCEEKLNFVCSENTHDIGTHM